ncbi:MAG: hypothetical protein LBC89_00695 [Bacteroidales bacterium]|jgi:hypothetical protein|nr:hypothetical protein [Bacteroidales bacterium]
MKKINYLTVLMVLVVCMGIFQACCKKEENAKSPSVEVKEWEEKIEYMAIPCVDFSRIKKEANIFRGGEPMLQFESWEHYASVIDAMLEFSYSYIDARVQQVRAENPGINDDDLSLILHNENVYQFMPLYSFCQQLQFDNSAFKKLRTEEIQWMKAPQAANRSNPFDEAEMGYIQSALHNVDGEVMIANEIFNPSIPEPARACRTCDGTNLQIKHGAWPTVYYNGKTRQIRGFLNSHTTHSYAKTSVYYMSGNTPIVWLCKVRVKVWGKHLKNCGDPSWFTYTDEFDSGNIGVFASVVEKYQWHITGARYLYPDPSVGLVFSKHWVEGIANVWQLSL